jgi:hypothetical protein
LLHIFYVHKTAITLPTLFRGREIACSETKKVSLLLPGRSKLSPNKGRFGTIFEAALHITDTVAI